MTDSGRLQQPAARDSLLGRFGLGRPELRAWAMYDWANSAFMTTIIAGIFPIYFSTVAAADLAPETATTRWAATTTIALIVVAVMSPILGAVADFAAVKLKMLAGFAFLGIVATASMVFIERGDWLLVAVLFALGNIGASGSFSGSTWHGRSRLKPSGSAIRRSRCECRS